MAPVHRASAMPSPESTAPPRNIPRNIPRDFPQLPPQRPGGAALPRSGSRHSRRWGRRCAAARRRPRWWRAGGRGEETRRRGVRKFEEFEEFVEFGVVYDDCHCKGFHSSMEPARARKALAMLFRLLKVRVLRTFSSGKSHATPQSSFPGRRSRLPRDGEACSARKGRGAEVCIPGDLASCGPCSRFSYDSFAFVDFLSPASTQVDWYVENGAKFLEDTEYPALPGFKKSFVTYQPLGPVLSWSEFALREEGLLGCLMQLRSAEALCCRSCPGTSQSGKSSVWGYQPSWPATRCF